MHIRNWRECAPVIVHESGVDWRLFNTKDSRFTADLKNEAYYNPEDSCMVVIRFFSRATLQPGKAYQKHSHIDHEEVYYILSGKGKIIVGDEKCPIKDGDCIYIPLDAEHQIINSGEETLELIAFGGNL